MQGNSKERVRRSWARSQSRIQGAFKGHLSEGAEERGHVQAAFANVTQAVCNA